MTRSVKLLSIATAVPPHVIDQRDAAAAAHRASPRATTTSSAWRGCSRAPASAAAHAVRPLEWYLEPLGWPERNAAYLEGASQLFIDAATEALDAAGVRGADVDTVVTVSSTGIATPSLEARVAGRIGFRADVERVPVFGLGCAGGVSGISIGDPAGAVPAGQPRARRRGRALHPGVPARQAQQGEHRRHRPVRRRRRGLRAAGRRRGHRRGGDERPAHLARHARHHGLGRRPRRASA